MASPTQWKWVGSWWWTGRPGVLQSMGSRRVGPDWATELNWRSRSLIGWWWGSRVVSQGWTLSVLRLQDTGLGLCSWWSSSYHLPFVGEGEVFFIHKTTQERCIKSCYLGVHISGGRGRRSSSHPPIPPLPPRPHGVLRPYVCPPWSLRESRSYHLASKGILRGSRKSRPLTSAGLPRTGQEPDCQRLCAGARSLSVSVSCGRGGASST